MTDKELLELAAKAAGYEVEPYLNFAGEWVDGVSAFYFVKGLKTWNPLTDDGDAFRLVVKLYKHMAFRLTDIFDAQFDGRSEACHATRKAIVLAAAQIAKKMD